MGQMRKACRILVGKYQMTALSETPRCKLGSNFKIGLRKICFEDMNWVKVAQNMVQWFISVNMFTNLWVP
jgi:hypothetical protein